MSTLTRHQAAGAYRRWELQDFGASTAPEPESEPVVEAPPPPEPEPPAEEPGFKLPTAEEIEEIYESTRKAGYDAGYEEGTARGRVEAMRLHGLVETLDAALLGFDGEVAEQLLDAAVEIARQLVRRELRAVPDTALGIVREALQQFPQNHAMVHLHPDDAALVREYLGEHLSHLGHRIVEDDAISRGGCRIEASGSQLDATVETRWRRIVGNLGRDEPLGRADAVDGGRGAGTAARNGDGN